MHQPTDGWLSLPSFVASPHHFPGQSIRKQRWKRETAADKDRMTDERNKEERMDEYSTSSQSCSSRDSNKNEKFHFLIRIVCVIVWVVGKFNDSLNRVDMPLKVLFQLHLCQIAQFFVFFLLWLFPENYVRGSHSFSFNQFSKIFMVNIKIKWHFYKGSSNLQYKLRGNRHKP